MHKIAVFTTIVHLALIEMYIRTVSRKRIQFDKGAISEFSSVLNLVLKMKPQDMTLFGTL